jgi:FixJ family two-component response regulator
VLASDEEDGTPDAPQFSFARDIVELVVLTADEAFLQTLREAVVGARRLWHVPSADKVSDLLVAGEVGILVLDVQALNESPAGFLGQIKRQFPDLVIVVAGDRDAEISLAGLISAGAVYRFIHKPMSPGRAKLFADAAVKKYDAHRSRASTAPAMRRSLRSHRGVLMGGAIGALGAIIAGSWIVHRSSQDNADLSHTPGVTQSPAAKLPREEYLDEASVAIETARKSGTDGRIAAMKSKGKQASVHEASEDKITPLLVLATQRINDAHLLDPDGDSARFYIQEALRLEPDNTAAQEAETALAMSLLAQAHAAIDRGDFAHASAWLDAAKGIASDANIDAVQGLLESAQRHPGADQSEAPSKAER